MPLLSIITCTYNSEKYLADCLTSIISQNLDPTVFEHIIIDGNSTDQTMKILESYRNDNPNHTINIIQKEPQGVYNAMNEGIKIAHGEYVIFANSDDFWELDILSQYIDYTKTYKNDIYYGRRRRINNNQIIGQGPGIGFQHQIQKILFLLGFGVLIHHPTTMIKKSLFDELGLYDETKKIASDYGFWLACIKAKKTFAYFPHIVTNFRVHPGSLTSNPANKQKERSENFFFRKKYFGQRGWCVQGISLCLWGLGRIQGLLSRNK